MRFVGWLVGLGLLAVPALAWNEEGHRAVALVAERQLSPAARRYVDAVLGEHPHDNSRTLSDSSCWPDKIRPWPEFHHGSWHYTNLPILLDGVQGPTQISGDAMPALNLCTRVLKDPRSSPSEKAVAMAWVVHLIGDIHQPLHAATGFSKRFPEGDRGATRFEVKMGQSRTNLHAFWDSAGGLFWKGANHARLDSIVDGLLKEFPEDEAVRVVSPKTWQDESHRLAVDVAYQGVQPDEALTPDYIERARQVSQARIALAGYRLAAYIERLSRASNARP